MYEVLSLNTDEISEKIYPDIGENFRTSHAIFKFHVLCYCYINSTKFSASS
jgi:hypothetical protein